MSAKTLLILGASSALLSLVFLHRKALARPFCLRPAKITPSTKVLRWKDLAVKYGRRYNIDPALILAIIHTESNGNPKAYRYERHIEDASRGLMQILYRTAREMGYYGKPQGLYDPETNINYGTKYLANRIRKYGFYKGIAAYNAGSPRYTREGCFINQPYVNKVIGAYYVYKRVAF